MAVRDVLTSPVALAWSALGAVAVGGVAVGCWRVATAVRTALLASDPLFLGGLVHLLALAAYVPVVVLPAVVWLPCSAGIAYDAGRRARGTRGSFRDSVSAVLDAGPRLARWVKTRLAVTEGVGSRLLTGRDVAPTEVAAGCGPYVVPALVLDAPGSLPRAVERANRMTPHPGRDRHLATGVGVTLLLALAVAAGPRIDAWSNPDVVGQLGVSTDGIAGGVLVVGFVTTAALDAARRARTYAIGDANGGFLGR